MDWCSFITSIRFSLVSTLLLVEVEVESSEEDELTMTLSNRALGGNNAKKPSLSSSAIVFCGTHNFSGRFSVLSLATPPAQRTEMASARVMVSLGQVETLWPMRRKKELMDSSTRLPMSSQKVALFLVEGVDMIVVLSTYSRTPAVDRQLRWFSPRSVGYK